MSADCPHRRTRKVGRLREGVPVVDADCIECGETATPDLLGRTIDRGRGVATDGGREIPPAPPEQEPEFVGAHSALTSENCQHWIGETTDDVEQCGRDATHTIVMADGSGLHEIASCDDCGTQADLESGDREWSGEVRADKQKDSHEYGPDPMPDGGTIVGDPSNPSETASPHTEEDGQ